MVNSFTPITTLRYWCQKVIPLVYEDSLSYYELLGKVVNKINELIANNNELPDLVVEQIKEMLDSDTLKEIVEEFLAETEGIVFDTDLTSNDIDIECLYNYFYKDGRTDGVTHHCVMQSMCIMPNGNFIGVFNDEQKLSNAGVIREFDNNGGFIREANVQIGHGQACTTDGNKIYVGWLTENYNGSETRTDKVSVIDYNSLTVDEVIHVVQPVNGIAYNYDNDTFIIYYNNKYYEVTKDLQVTIREFIVDQKIYNASQIRQDIMYYKNMVGQFINYPNIICFYSLDDGKLVKMYNIGEKVNTGAPITEIESGQFYNGEIYICGFSRLEDGEYGYVNICKIDPWKNTYNTYAKYARYNGDLNIYVDGDTTSYIQDGSIEHPFKFIGMACSVLHSSRHTNTPLKIKCKSGTNVGFLILHDKANLDVNVYGDIETNYTLKGVRLSSVSNFKVRNATILKNTNSGSNTSNACAFIEFSTGMFIDCSVDGVNNEVGIYATYSAIDCEDVNFSNVVNGWRINHLTQLHRSGGTFNVTGNVCEVLGNSEDINRFRVKPNSVRMSAIGVPNIQQIRPMSETDFRRGTYDLNDSNIDNYIVADTVNGLNYAVFDIVYESVIQTHMVSLRDSGIQNFIVDGVILRTANHLPFIYEITGEINLVNKTLFIDDVRCYRLDTNTYYSLKDEITGVSFPTISKFSLI